MRDSNCGNQAKTAVAVHQFLSALPKELQQHVFKQILEDAFAQAEFLTEEEAFRQFIQALNFHFFLAGPIEELCSALFTSPFSEELASALENQDDDKWNELAPQPMPGLRDIIGVFQFFSLQEVIGYSEGSADNMEKDVAALLQAKSIDLKTNESQLEFNTFEKLGYLTLMANIFDKENLQSPKYIDLFKCWYVDGQILDVVFDTIFNCKITSIKRSLWNLLQSKCLDDQDLCKVANLRWTEYVSFNNITSAVSSHTFKTIDRLSEEEMVEPLGEINHDVNYEEMYYYLVNEKNVLNGKECSLEQFEKIFSKRDGKTKVKRITFHCKSEKEVGNYMVFFHMIYKDKIKYEGITSRPDFIEQRFKKTLKFTHIHKGEEIESNYKSRNADEAGGDALYNELNRMFKQCGFIF